MSERMTKARLQEREDNLNRRLAGMGSRKRVQVGHRYNYTALDEGYIDAGGRFVPVSDPLRAGTKGEIADALWLMMRALDLAAEREGDDGD